VVTVLAMESIAPQDELGNEPRTGPLEAPAGGAGGDPLDREFERALSRDGFVVLPGFFSDDELAAVHADLDVMYPSAADFHADVDPERNARFRTGMFGGVDYLPFESLAWNLLAVHPRLIEVARRALDTTDVRLYQAEAWAKYSSAADYDQWLHRDFTNHTLLVPTDDPRFGHVEMFLYVNGVDLDTGPTLAVPRRHTADVPLLPNQLRREEHAALYAREVPVVGPPGTLLVYWPDTVHRGSPMARLEAARYTIHLNFRTAAAEWVSRRGWAHWANHPTWVPFVEQLSPDQLAVFGFPPPGHAYWTARTLQGVQRRYPRLDLEPWRAGVRDAAAAEMPREAAG
jgi:hypothetical protein